MEEAERLLQNEKPCDRENSKLFSAELTGFPHISEFIQKLQDQIKEQQSEIQKLQEDLKSQNSTSNVSHNETQTDCISENKNDMQTQTISIEHHFCHAQTQTKDEEQNEDISKKNLVNEIKQAAESSMLQTGFVYEETSGLYYDYKSGYYYDSKSGLYYDGNSGTYYYYDTEKKSFQYHYKIDTEVKESSDEPKNKLDINGKLDINEDDDSEIEDGELVECIDLTDSDVEKNLKDKKESDDVRCMRKDLIKPCIRIIVKETDIPSVKVGTLFIVSFQGGSIGREGDHTVIIPDINISKHHAKLQFNETEKCYEIIDLGSRNGTYLNGKRLSSAKQESEPKQIVHGSTLQMNSTKLLCHIHDGYETCGHCEPGLIQSDCIVEYVSSKSSKALHQKELKRLKSKFGIENISVGGVLLKSDYQDRAQLRRLNIGSSSEHVKTKQTSVNECISENNMGFKMLKKMGWSEGSSLGKTGEGVVEPILVQQNLGRTGLGAENIVSDHGTDNTQLARKRKILVKTKRRFDQIDTIID